jgi:M6 family metalloprotease-like protein
MDHPARYYLIDNLGPIELIPSAAGVGNIHRYEGVTIQVTGNLVSQNNQRTLYLDKWVPLEARAAAEFPAVSGPQSTVVILVEFSDNTASHTAAQMGELVFGTSGNAMNAYYIEVSYNSITITGGYTSVWNKLSHPTTYYNVNTWSSCAVSGDFWYLARDIVNLVDSYVNFASYQHFMIVTADSYVWGCSVSGLHIWTNDGVYFEHAAFVTETMGLATFAHEFGHDLGLPDLYDYSYSDPYHFIDGWDEMSMDNAQHFASWSKIQLGWIPPSKIATFTGSTVTQTISRIEYTTSGYHALKIKTSAMPTSVYFLVETRQKVGFDVNIPSSAPDHGVLMTKIDESKGSGQGIVRLVDANPTACSPNWPRCYYDGDAVWQVDQTYSDSSYGFSVYVQSWSGTGFTITVSSTFVPYVSTDKTTYAQLESILFTGTGFTPGGSISSCISTDNDGSLLCITQPNADGQGNVAGTMQVGTNIPVGPQKFMGWDVSTGRYSNAVQLTITSASTVTVTVTRTLTESSTSYLYRTTTTTTTSYTSTTTSTSTIPTVTTVVLVPLTITSTDQSTQFLTSVVTTTVTSYTSTTTSTSTIPTTVALVPLTMTSTAQSTQYLTSLLTTTVTSYTGTETSTSTIVVPTTVILVPNTVTSTVQSTQYLTSVLTTTVTSYTSTTTSTSTIPTTVALVPLTATSTIQNIEFVTSVLTTTETSYTATTTSTSTSVVYTTVTVSPGGAGAGASSPLAYLGFLSLLAVAVGRRVTAGKGLRIPKVRSVMERARLTYRVVGFGSDSRKEIKAVTNP